VKTDLATLIEGVTAAPGSGDDILEQLRSIMLVRGVDPNVLKRSVLDHLPRYY